MLNPSPFAGLAKVIIVLVVFGVLLGAALIYREPIFTIATSEAARAAQPVEPLSTQVPVMPAVVPTLSPKQIELQDAIAQAQIDEINTAKKMREFEAEQARERARQAAQWQAEFRTFVSIALLVSITGIVLLLAAALAARLYRSGFSASTPVSGSGNGRAAASTLWPDGYTPTGLATRPSSGTIRWSEIRRARKANKD